jgi:hypothetical protein
MFSAHHWSLLDCCWAWRSSLRVHTALIETTVPAYCTHSTLVDISDRLCGVPLVHIGCSRVLRLWFKVGLVFRR